MKFYRQGDILLVATDDQAQGKEMPRSRGRLVLAYGESTGHTHAIAEPEVKAYGMAPTEITWIVSPVPFEVKHEEHATVSVPAGTYHVVRQSDYRRREIVRIVD